MIQQDSPVVDGCFFLIDGISTGEMDWCSYFTYKLCSAFSRNIISYKDPQWDSRAR